MDSKKFIHLSKRMIKHVIWTYEFLFAVIIIVGFIFLADQLIELYYQPKPAVIADTALNIAEKNTVKLNALEQKVDAQGKIIPQTVIVEKRVAYETKPFENASMRARAQRLRAQQNASGNNR